MGFLIVIEVISCVVGRRGEDTALGMLVLTRKKTNSGQKNGHGFQCHQSVMLEGSGISDG